MLAIYNEEREAGWQEWLQRYKLYDSDLTEPQLYMRYQKFKGLDLGPLVDDADRWQYYRDLVPLKPTLVCGDALGRVEEYPFHFEVLDDHLLCQKPIVYPPE